MEVRVNFHSEDAGESEKRAKFGIIFDTREDKISPKANTPEIKATINKFFDSLGLVV